MKRVVVLLALAACSGRGTGNGAEQQDKQLPDEATLCKLSVGYAVDSGSIDVGGDVLGTNSDDVRAVLGEPTSRTDTEFTYDWCVGADCPKHVSATLTFVKVDRCYRDTGKPVTPPYWLSDVEVTGFAMPECWQAGSEMPQLCAECLARNEIAECK